MITFNSFILFGFILRVLFVITGAVLTIRIIGLKNIQFLKQYIRAEAFSPYKLFYWFVAFLSIVYFEHLVSDANGITFSEVYIKNLFLSLFVMLLLFGVVGYAFKEMLRAVGVAKEVEKELGQGKTFKTIMKFVNDVSWYIPYLGVYVKSAVFGLSFLGELLLDAKIAKTLSTKIKANIEIMLIIAVINLLIILISTYLITDQILFW